MAIKDNYNLTYEPAGITGINKDNEDEQLRMFILDGQKILQGTKDRWETPEFQMTDGHVTYTKRGGNGMAHHKQDIENELFYASEHMKGFMDYEGRLEELNQVYADSEKINQIKAVMNLPETTYGETFTKLAKIKEIVEGME